MENEEKGEQKPVLTKEDTESIAKAVSEANAKTIKDLKSSKPKKKNYQKEKASQNEFDYTITGPEFEWLLSVIKFKSDFLIKTKVDPLSRSDDVSGNRSTIKDDQIKDLCKELVRSILEALSPKYIAYLSDKYFGDEDQLITYVAEMTTDRFYSYVVKLNSDIQKKFLEKENSKAVLKANSAK